MGHDRRMHARPLNAVEWAVLEEVESMCEVMFRAAHEESSGKLDENGWRLLNLGRDREYDAAAQCHARMSVEEALCRSTVVACRSRRKPDLLADGDRRLELEAVAIQVTTRCWPDLDGYDPSLFGAGRQPF